MAWKGHLTKFNFTREQLKQWWALRGRARKCAHKCAFCGKVFQPTDWKVVDHKKPHRGDPKLFLDPLNLQVLCARCHSSRKQLIERNEDKPEVGLDGWQK